MGRSRSIAVVTVAVGLGLGMVGCGRGQGSVQAQPGAGSAVPLTLPAPRGSAAPTSDGDIGKGIGGLITPGATVDYLSAVAARTKQVNTGRFHLVAAVTGGAGHDGTTTLTELDGAFDKDAGKGRITLDTSGASAQGDSLAGLFGGGPIEMVTIGPTGYLKMPDLLGMGEATWTKVDDPDQSSLKTIFDMFKVDDIAGFVESLRCAGNVTEVGHERVDQVETTHYRADVDTAKLATCRGTDANAGQLLDNFGDATSGTVDVWVDAGSLVRKLVTTADERALGADLAAKYPGGTATLTMTLSGFGEPVDIEPPPPDQISEGGLGGLDLGSLGDLGGR